MAFEPTPKRLIDFLRAQRAPSVSTRFEPGLRTESAPQEATQPGGFQRLLSRLTSPLIDVPELPGGPVGDILETGLEDLSSPIGLATTALIPFTGGTSLGLRGAAGLAARAGTRVGAEAAVGGLAGTAAREASQRLPEDIPGPIRGALTIGAAAAAGGAGTAALRSAGRQAVEEGIEQAITPQGLGVTSQEAAELTNAVKNARILGRSQQRQLTRSIRAQRFSDFERRLEQQLGRGAGGEQAIGRATGALRGAMPQVRFDVPQVSPASLAKLNDEIATTKGLSVTERIEAWRGLNQKIMVGAVPDRAEIRSLNRVFGEGLTEEILKKRSFGPKVMDAINTPRALMASGDFSGPFRQGILLISHPREFFGNIVPMIRAFVDPDFYKQSVDGLHIRARQLAEDLSEELGIPQGQVGNFKIPAITDQLVAREEPFMGAGLFGQRGLLGQTLIGANVRASERAFSLYLSALRFDVYEKTVRNWMRTGRATKENVDEMAEVLNALTGRGNHRILEGTGGQILNAAFFAPRLTLDRFLAPKFLATASPEVRKEVARSFGGFLAFGVGMLGLMGAAARAGVIPNFSVETDPRSADFGKGRIGETRIDFWGGYQQIARAVAQTVTMERKSASGAVRDITLQDAVWDGFIRSKVSPQTGLAWDVVSGETFLGDRVEPGTFPDQLKERVLPFAVQDILEGYEEAGASGALLAAPSVFGFGVTSYRSLGEAKADAAQRHFGKEYGDLTGAERLIVDQDPKVRQKIAEFDLKAGDSFGKEIERIDADRIAEEQTFMADLLSGRFRSRREFADAIMESQRKAATLRDKAVKQFNIPAPSPTSPLQVALASWYELFELADRGYDRGIRTGQVDWERFDQLERDLFATLSREQRDFIDQRARAQHDPTVQWFFNNRDYINNSGYYEVADEQFEKVAASVRRVFPDVDSYGDLLTIKMNATATGDRRVESLANRFIRTIDRRVSTIRERMRVRDPKLDRALFETGRTTTFKTSAARNLGSPALDTAR